MARSPILAHHVLADDGKALDLRVLRSRARAQAVHHGRSLSEQEQHDHQDQEQVAQEAGYAGEDHAESLGEGAGFHHLSDVHVREPQTLEHRIEVAQFPIQLRRVESKAFAESRDRNAQYGDESQHENRYHDEHDHQGQRRW